MSALRKSLFPPASAFVLLLRTGAARAAHRVINRRRHGRRGLGQRRCWALVGRGMPVLLGVLGSAAAAQAAPFAYITNFNSASVSVIDTATNTVTATVAVGSHPRGVAVTPDGSRVYITNRDSNTVSVIDT